jgi:hypothetical protein
MPSVFEMSYLPYGVQSNYLNISTILITRVNHDNLEELCIMWACNQTKGLKKGVGGIRMRTKNVKKNLTSES